MNYDKIATVFFFFSVTFRRNPNTDENTKRKCHLLADGKDTIWLFVDDNCGLKLWTAIVGENCGCNL